MLAERANSMAPAAKKPEARAPAPQKKAGTDMISKMAGSAARAAGSQVGREIIRGILGSLSRK
jgi:hypothetical protein